ncbi:outer membrane beta-barrel protein, partial [Novosphingobium piscinae]
MKKIAFLTAAAAAALATPALARDDQWYVEADVGAVKAENIFNLTGVGNAGVLKTKAGYDFGGIVGYDFGGFRLEAEASFRRVEEANFTTATQSFTNAQVGGGAEALSFMANGLLDFGPDNGLQGFIGGGVGVGRVKNAVLTAVNAVNVNDSDTGLAWQALAGVRAPVTDHVDIGLKYRFYNQNGNDLVNNAGRNVRTR